MTGLIQQNHVRVGEQPIELKLELADLPQLKPVVVAIVEAADVILEGLGFRLACLNHGRWSNCCLPESEVS